MRSQPIQMVAEPPSMRLHPGLFVLFYCWTQGLLQDARRKAAWAGRPWVEGLPAEIFGSWTDPWPQAVRGDPVRCFDELSAARGALGRFPGSQVMTLVKQFAQGA